MRLNELLFHLNEANVQGEPTREIRGLAYDSRHVQPGYLFVAIKGYHANGHAYISQAIANGAGTIVADARYIDDAQATSLRETSDVTYITVPNSRKVLAPLASTWYGCPSHRMGVVGITGTKGKTTTTMLTSTLLDRGGFSTGMISTVDFKVGTNQWPNMLRQSTPEAPEVQELLRQMVDAGCTHAVIESSSHALSPEWDRLGHCAFDVAVCTNVTHEHLDYHGSIEQYRFDKTRLFTKLASYNGIAQKAHKYAIVNADDPHHQMFLDAAPTTATRLTYAVHAAADIRAHAIDSTPNGSRMQVTTPWGTETLTLQLPGTFNILNALAALSVALTQGMSLSDACAALADVPGIRGRMERIDAGQPFPVFVDYAHNPDSFIQVMEMVRPQTPRHLIVVFGSAGERDVEKRAKQGEIAAEYCDRIFLTDEDPRGEPSAAILADIARGVEQAGKVEGYDYLCIPDRATAIQQAMSYAQPGDLVLLLGKGHESSIEYADGKHPWDEAAQARQALQEAGYTAE